MQNLNVETICCGYHTTAQFNTFHSEMKEPYIVLTASGHVIAGAFVPGQTIVIGGLDDLERLGQHIRSFVQDMRLQQTKKDIRGIREEGE